MIKLEKSVMPSGDQWKAIIRGMRNPMNSWDKSDSFYTCDHSGHPCHECIDHVDCRRACSYRIGPNDHKLMMNLRNAGADHRKFMRMIIVYLDITAPLYWWKEFDTYKIATVANSCSTMHKIHAKEFTLEDFSHEQLYLDSTEILEKIIKGLNAYREDFLHAKEANDPNAKEYWWQMIQMLPTSYNQKRTVMLNYEVLANIYKSRKNHKLDEWRKFCECIEGLPYSELITGGNDAAKDVQN